MRILDFYLLFPFRIEGIRLRREDRKYRKLAGEYEKNKPYGDQPEDRNVFARMEPMQLCALDTLASRRFISPEKWTTAEVVTTSEPVLGALGQRVVEINTQEADLLDFLRVLASYDLLGPDGLKARSALLEARYDAI